MKCIDDEIPFEVPDGWEWCRLNSIATFELGKTLDTAKNTGTYKPYLRSVNVRWNSVDLSDINCMKFEPDELARYSVKKGDLLICEGGDVGRSCVWEKDDEMYYQNALHRVRFYMNINPYFYMYIMMYYANSGKLQEVCKGVTIKHLTKTTLLTLLFPVPPQNESLNIINKILEFDYLLQNLEENKDDISSLISCAKSKILNLAIRGKLVPQDPNDESASILLERIRAEKEELIKQGKIKRDKKESIIFRGDDNSYYGDIPDNWAVCSLKDLFRVCSAKRVCQSDWKTHGVPFYRAREIVKLSDNGYVENELFISEEHYNQLKSEYDIPKAGDLMVSGVGTIGKIYVVKEGDRFYYKDASVLCFENRSGIIDSQYARYMLESECLQAQMKDNSKCTTVDTITISAAMDYVCILPPLTEQKRIVTAIKTTFSYLDNILKALC